MMRILAVMLVAFAATGHAQHGGAQAIRNAPPEAAQFAFLVGQWDLIVRPAATSLGAKIHGVPKMAGTWKGWRAFDGHGIEDELRITDESGNPRGLSHSMRYYDATTKRWTSSSLDVYRSAFTASTALWKDGVMTMTSRGTDAEGKAYMTRTRFTDITATAFKFRQERSTDAGETWKESLTIDGKRVAAVAPR